MAVASTTHAGHNAKVPGAGGNGYREHEVVRTINSKIRAITGATDCTDDASASVSGNLANIVSKMNRIAKDWHLSHHLNAFNGTANGVEVWYYTGDSQAAAMAAKVSAAIASALGITNRGAKATTSLYVIRNSKGRCLLIEWCFVDNANDIRKLMSNMDRAISAALSCFGYSSAPAPAPNPAPSKPATTDTRDLSNGTKVKIRSVATHYQTGQKINKTVVNGKTYTISQKKLVNQSNSKYAYLLSGIQSWVLAQDLDVVSSAGGNFGFGQSVTIQAHATNWQTGQAIPSWVKGKSYKIKQVKNVNQSNSKKAFLLEGIQSWILEQDVS